jgi:hypothetical protein
MKKIMVLLVLFGATHSNFAMEPGDKRGSSRRTATVDEIKRSKSGAEQRTFRERRPSISEDINSANKRLVEGFREEVRAHQKEVREYQDLSAQTEKERFDELRGLLHGLIQHLGAFEKRVDAVSVRLARVETRVTKLIEATSGGFVWPEVLNVDEEPAEQSRFPFASGGEWEMGDTADQIGGQ